MESRDHARLGPSAAHRWMHCPASIRLTESLEITGADTGSIYAAEGTAAHTVAELRASLAFGKINRAQYDAALAAWRGSIDGVAWLGDRTVLEVQEEMIEHAETYVRVLGSYREPNDLIHLELKVNPGVPSVWGTGDTVLIGPKWVTIVDYKYGEGVRVDAEGNEQLMFYGAGAAEADLLGTATHIRMVICQPRLSHHSVWEIPIAQLLEWRDKVAIPAAELALSDDAPFGPGEDTCRFCPVRGRCKAQTEWIGQRDFGQDLDLMDGDDYAEALRLLPAVKQWAADVEEKALQRVYSDGEKIPGYKVVLSGGKRVITDEEAAILKLVQAGFPRDKVERTPPPTIETLGVLEKVTKVRGIPGPKMLKQLLGDELITMTPGRPSLVPESDNRPEHVKEDQAANDFLNDPLDD